LAGPVRRPSRGHASAFLFGRRTFEIFRGHWPDQTDPADPLATAINSLPKYVVSNSLSEAAATWRNEHPETAHLVSGDVVAAVRALKNEPGDELQIWGSGNLLQTLLRHELVDRFRLMTFRSCSAPAAACSTMASSPRPCAPLTSPSPNVASSSATTSRPVRSDTVRCSG
jgi:dihydrofolate reductase